MRTLPNASIDLVYIDPPFMTNTIRSSSNGQNYEDRWSGGIGEYREFLKVRLIQIHRLLRESGTVYVHVDPRVGHHVRLLLDEIFGAGNFLNEVIWSYRTGGVSAKWFGRKHDTILVYAKALGKHTFNTQRDGTYRTDGLKHDEAGRPYKITKKGRLYFHGDGPMVTDVWEIPFLSTVSLERTGYPTQKPEALLERIVRAGSMPGDLVADFFCGSGTTLAVAKRMGRKWFGCDAGEEAVEIARGRLERVETQVESG
jgi:DNA modification methylase